MSRTRRGEKVACETCDAKAGERCVRLWDTRRHSRRDEVPPLPRSHPARVLAETFNGLMPLLAERIRTVPACGHQTVVMSCSDCKSPDGLLISSPSVSKESKPASRPADAKGQEPT